MDSLAGGSLGQQVRGCWMLMALVMSLLGVIASVADGPALGDGDPAPETEEFFRESPDPDQDYSEWQLGAEAS